MLIPRSEFPIRPSRLAGESLPGYAYRFHWANGHDIPVTLRGALRLLFQGVEVNSVLIDFGGEADDFQLSDRRRQLLQEVEGTGVARDYGRWRRQHYNPFRYCPSCLKKARFHAVLWMLPLVEACPIHQCELLSRCVVCGSPLSWGGLRAGWRCRCGADLAEAQSGASCAWTVRLAARVAQTADGQRVGYADGPRRSSNTGSGESLDDVYNLLEWAHVLRRQLARRPPSQQWPKRLRPQKPNPRTMPRAWEERILSIEPRTLELLIHRLVRWEFREHSSVLVARDGAGALGVVTKALHQLPMTPSVVELRRKAEALLEPPHSEIAALPWVQFHPRIDASRRRDHLASLADWWHRLAMQLAVLHPDAELKPNCASESVRYSSDSVLLILNEFLLASYRNDPVHRYWKLIKRWHVPERVRRRFEPGEVLGELGNFLADLSASEGFFVRDLVKDA
ncbi:hypothetical protein R11007_01546 [Ralstonia holmesii]|nr:hypothetical protein R11007_01546 [Ralstonia sp. LMG 32967]